MDAQMNAHGVLTVREWDVFGDGGAHLIQAALHVVCTLLKRLIPGTVVTNATQPEQVASQSCALWKYLPDYSVFSGAHARIISEQKPITNSRAIVTTKRF
jgi:hypothetical protein